MPHPRRLSSVVPSLQRIGLTGPARRGFTLIEILVAIAISALIILTAVQCFRMISNAIGAANALSAENSLLRSGMQLALLDADFWRSHADDRPPFNKGFQRVAAKPDVGTTGAGDTHVYENTWTRPFRPVLYAPRTDTAVMDPDATRGANLYNAAAPTLANWHVRTVDNHFNDPYNRSDYVPNPNAMMAHDPRSISRMPLRPMRNPQTEIGAWRDNAGRTWRIGDTIGVYRLGYPRLALGDYALVAASDMRDTVGTPIGEPGPQTPRYPVNDPPATPVAIAVAKNWELPTSVIDLGKNPHEMAAPNYIPTLTTLPAIDIPLDNGWSMHQPLMHFDLYHRLYYFGLFQYMTPGTAVLFGDRHGMTPERSTVPLAPYTYRSSNFTQQYMWDRDWSFNFGVSDLAVRMGERFIPSQSSGGWSARAIEALPLRTCWPAPPNDAWLNSDESNYRNPFVVFIGTGDYSGNNNTEALAAVLQAWGINTMHERGDVTRTDQTSLSTTVWLPYNTTDYERAEPVAGTSIAPTATTPAGSRAQLRALDLTTKPKQAPIMQTSILRYGRVAGSYDLTVTRVVVEDPITARKIELTCMPFGTNYRGARQHWRLYSPAWLETAANPSAGHLLDIPSDSCIGDFYDVGPTSAGPYYVP